MRRRVPLLWCRRRHAGAPRTQALQRTRIHNVVLRRGFVSRFRVTNVNFAISIGVVVPRSFHLFVVPEEIVFIAPHFRRFLCFVFDDELVIVDPFTSRSSPSSRSRQRRPRPQSGGAFFEHG